MYIDFMLYFLGPAFQSLTVAQKTLPCPYQWQVVGNGASPPWQHHWKPLRKNLFWIQSLLMTFGCLRSTEKAKKTQENVSFFLYKYLHVEIALLKTVFSLIFQWGVFFKKKTNFINYIRKISGLVKKYVNWPTPFFKKFIWRNF